MKLIIFAMSLVSPMAMACANFSGTYVDRFRPEDYRKEMEFRLTQTGCEKLEFDKYVFRYRDGKVEERPNDHREDITDGVIRGGNGTYRRSNTWIGNVLEVFTENINKSDLAF